MQTAEEFYGEVPDVPAAGGTLVFLTRKFSEFKKLEASLKTQMEEARANKERWEEALIGKMLEDGISNVRTAEGMFYNREDVYAGYDRDREPEMFEYLEQSGNSDLIRPTINARTLTAWVKEREEMGFNLPNFITVTRKSRIGLRK